jgi:hypothetical protein
LRIETDVKRVMTERSAEKVYEPERGRYDPTPVYFVASSIPSIVRAGAVPLIFLRHHQDQLAEQHEIQVGPAQEAARRLRMP